ncbi:hypothetical protein BD560DRAFT_371709 [Blakeslea trispora]|nr:hypothetical protein BD560DRAFT_371709 [Blakeslea trispora]
MSIPLSHDYSESIPLSHTTNDPLLLAGVSDTLYGPPDLIMNNSSSTTVSGKRERKKEKKKMHSDSPPSPSEFSQELLTEITSQAEKEAAFPPIYTVLPTTKLEEEPNPFEESFEGATEPIPPTKISPKIMMDTPLERTDVLFVEDQWKCVGSGMLSPSIMTDNKQSRRSSSTGAPKQSRKSSANKMEDEEKRKNFLERNRIAALKCRQRKKQWLQNLQAKVEYLVTENEQYHLQANALREELIQLKTLLMAHKDCPVNQSATQVALSRPLPPSCSSSSLAPSYSQPPTLLPSLKKQ